MIEKVFVMAAVHLDREDHTAGIIRSDLMVFFIKNMDVPVGKRIGCR